MKQLVKWVGGISYWYLFQTLPHLMLKKTKHIMLFGYKILMFPGIMGRWCYTSRVFSHLQLNFHSFPLQPASASSLRRHVATTLMQHRRANERNSRALQPVSPASYGSSLEVSIIIYQVSL